jgi:acyl carrier protein
LDSAQQARLEKSGLGVVNLSQGLALFEAALGRREAQLIPVPIDLAQLRKSFAEAVPPLWRELIRAPRTASASARRGAWARELSLLPQERRLEAAIAAVRGEVARVLSLEGAEAVASERPLKELGLDSLMALELRNALGKHAGVTLPATLAFDYPTPAAIAKYLLENVLSLSAAASTPAPIVVTRPMDQELQKRITEIEELSSVELERELSENMQLVLKEFGL